MEKLCYGYKGNIKVEVFDSYEGLSVAAADYIAALMLDKPDIILGLATGSSPIA